jgi:hypothetical protein
MYLTKEQILGAQDTPTEVVDVPEWGGKIIVRTLNGTERDQLEQSIMVGDNEKNLVGIRAKYAALSIIDEQGNRLFTFEDIEALGKKSAKALDRVFDACQRLSGLTTKDVEELAGNSGGAQKGASTSD